MRNQPVLRIQCASYCGGPIIFHAHAGQVQRDLQSLGDPGINDTCQTDKCGQAAYPCDLNASTPGQLAQPNPNLCKRAFKVG